jgi:cell division protein FtsA
LSRRIIDTRREVAVLDIGTSKICAAVARGERRGQTDLSLGPESEIRILGVGHQLAKGIKRGIITNLEEFEESVLGAISSAEKEAQRAIKSVFIALPSLVIESSAIEKNINIGHLPVDDVHLRSLSNFDATRCIGRSREVIHVFPVSYSIDGNSGIQDPTGMIGEALSAVFHVMSVNSSFLNNIRSCLSRNNIDVSGFMSSTYGAVISATLDEEISSGITLIDIGGSSTSIMCIHEGAPLYLGTIPVGGQNITNDIAMVLRTTTSNAERLKIVYGVSETSVDKESISIYKIDEYGEEHTQSISKGMLDSVISDRLEEIFELIQKHIYECGAEKSLYQRIIITGGGSQLSGLTEFMRSKKYFRDISVRIGKPIGTIGSHDFVKKPSFSSAAGAAIYCLGDFLNKRLSDEERSLWQKLITWFKRGV